MTFGQSNLGNRVNIFKNNRGKKQTDYKHIKMSIFSMVDLDPPKFSPAKEVFHPLSIKVQKIFLEDNQ